MRVAIVVAVFVVVLVAGLVGVVVPSSGQTIPPPTETPCDGDCGVAPTARPTDSEPITPAPGCEGTCFPAPTPRPPDSLTTPSPGCTGPCFPFPTPRPTYAPGATIEPANPGNGTGIWYYSFLPSVRLRH